MNDRMFKEIGRKVLVTSGYRSPAYQLLFAYYLDMYDFDIQKTDEKSRTSPGYSEHSVADYVAIDFYRREYHKIKTRGF